MWTVPETAFVQTKQAMMDLVTALVLPQVITKFSYYKGYTQGPSRESRSGCKACNFYLD